MLCTVFHDGWRGELGDEERWTTSGCGGDVVCVFIVPVVVVVGVAKHGQSEPQLDWLRIKLPLGEVFVSFVCSTMHVVPVPLVRVVASFGTAMDCQLLLYVGT